MKHAALVSCPLSLLLAARVGAQEAPAEPIPADYPPLIIEAEAGSIGAEFQTLVEGDVTAVTISPSQPNAASPGNAERVLSYEVLFPAPGEYELYMRFRVGPGGASDDSFFYGNGFGQKDSLAEADWITANNLSQAGYSAPEQIVGGDFGIPLGTGFRWLNLSEFDEGGEAPVRFTVTEGELAQTIQLGAREDGLVIDKLAFVASPVSQTIAELDAGLPGNILPPPPPPRECTPRGPALAENQSKFLGSAYSPAQAPNFTAYFNQVTPENAGKWGSVERDRDVMDFTQLDEAYEFARDNGLPFKLHTLIWGNQQPAWIETLPPEEQLEEIDEWFAALAARYPDVEMIEVVNEPLHDPPSTPGNGGGNYINALGGAGATGWDWIVASFRMARQYFPTSELVLNDYSIINNTADTARYLQIIALLQAEDLIDAIGEQGHAFSTRGAVDVMQSNLDSLAATGLPIYITELDIDGPTDEVQLLEYQRLFPMFWEHPSVLGVTLWGYRPGHWRTAQGAFLALAGGTERPALTWLREYLESPAVTPVVSGQVLHVAQAAAAGTALGTLEALGAAPNSWLVLGGSGAELFDVDAATGVVSVAAGAELDATQTPELTLEVVARDECTPTRVTIAVSGLPNTAPVIEAGQVLELDADLVVHGSVVASDAEGNALSFALIGGSGEGLFSVDPATGAVERIAVPRFDVAEYSLVVTADDGRDASEPSVVDVLLPARVRVCLAGRSELVPRAWVPIWLRFGADLGACSEPAESWQSALHRWIGALFGIG
ncbi:MAG TPA: endo-1,4-beta-xylanase [Polyangiaceae bacterium]|nr:endo-1,4-beta-xylanase [Polyangiaceae bacterium]